MFIDNWSVVVALMEGVMVVDGLVRSSIALI